MIFKVLYQESKEEVPVRESTKTIFVEANSEREVRKKLIERALNIEFVQELKGATLNYEKQSEHFEVETL